MIETISPLKQRFFKHLIWFIFNLAKTNFKICDPQQFQTRAIYENQDEIQSSRSYPKLKHDPKIQGSKRLKTVLNSWGGDQNLRNLGKNSCSCNNWRLPGEPRSLDNFFLMYQTIDNKTNMLNSSRCLDFPNGDCMYF